MVIFFVLIIISILTLFNYFLHEDFLYPGLIQSLLWFIITLLYMINQVSLPSLNTKTLLLIMLGVLMFSIGSFVTTYEHKPVFKKTYNFQNYNNYILKFFLLISIVGLIIYIYKSLNIMLNGPTTNLFMNLRISDIKIGIVGRFIFMSNMTTIIYTIFYDKTKLFYISFIVSLTYAVLGTGRTYIFALIIPVFFIGLVLRKFKITITAFGFLILSIFIFSIYSIILNKGGSLDFSFQENIIGVYKSFLTYFFGPLISLDFLLKYWNDFNFVGSFSFRTLYKMMNIFGANFDVTELVREYSRTKISVNVFTVYDPYFRDFFILGPIFFQFIFGFSQGFLYKKATLTNPNLFYVFLYSLSIYPLFMQFFQDQYFSLLSTWFQYCFFIILFMFLSSKLTKE